MYNSGRRSEFPMREPFIAFKVQTIQDAAISHLHMYRFIGMYLPRVFIPDQFLGIELFAFYIGAHYIFSKFNYLLRYAAYGIFRGYRAGLVKVGVIKYNFYALW